MSLLYTWIQLFVLKDSTHDDLIKWKHFLRYWPFVRGIHRSSVNSPHKGQWRGALMFSLIGAWTGGWVNNRDAGDLRRYDTHYDATVLPHAVSVLHLNGNVCIMCTASSSNLQNILNRCNWKEGMVVVGINACTRSSREFEWFNFEIRHPDNIVPIMADRMTCTIDVKTWASCMERTFVLLAEVIWSSAIFD